MGEKQKQVFNPENIDCVLLREFHGLVAQNDAVLQSFSLYPEVQLLMYVVFGRIWGIEASRRKEPQVPKQPSACLPTVRLGGALDRWLSMTLKH